MEAALKDFEEWMKSLPVIETKYYAVFDPATGKVSGIYPDHSCPDTVSKIEIDEEISRSVVEGKTTLNSYIVDTENESLEFIETKSLTKIDDVLHRVIEEQWSENQDFDIIIIANREKNFLKIELDEKFYKSRKILWDGNTEMLFLITDYNDPNGLYNVISITINKLFDEKYLEFPIDFPKEFSIYTRRIFKNYILKNENS